MPHSSAPLPANDGWTLIHTYTRANALRDGTLVDATDLAREAGFCIPVALTAAAWAETVAMTSTSVPAGEIEPGRLWDVLWMLRCAIASGGGDRSDVLFRVLVDQQRPETERLQLRALIGPGDDAEPVITILLPGED